MQRLKTAVLPVAGLGSRFLPITKSIPKEMLPIIDKPLIQFAIEEAIEAGIEKIVFVTSYTKKAIEDYFSINSELEKRLLQSNKENLIEKIHPKYLDKVEFSYVSLWEHREPYVSLYYDDDDYYYYCCCDCYYYYCHY